jgi:uncharacterized protein (DUF983 family)
MGTAQSTVAYATEEGTVYKCPSCNKVNGREGFEKLYESICEHCGQEVEIKETIDQRNAV